MADPIQTVRLLARRGRLAHAWLVTGPAGAGKHAMALTLAQALVCTGEEAPCGVCLNCKKVEQGIHPDVITVSPQEGKREIMVEQARQLRTDAYVLPNEARRKVYIIDPASEMNENAQNALLKVLEEGPAYAAFLLLAEASGQVLPTIRSRCEQLSLIPALREGEEPSEDAVILADLLTAGKESALLAFCVKWEKAGREDWAALLIQTILELERRVRKDPLLAADLLPTIDHLNRLRAACDRNVGAGHLAGWLCAGNH